MQNGRAHGMSRSWHPNDVLASEVPFEIGLQHGIARFWGADGRLFGEYSMDRGTGVFKRWYDNGVLAHETTTLKGLPTGLQKCWDENADFIVEAFWIRGKKVSHKKYLEACKTDPELPQYPETKSQVSRKKV